MRYASLAVLAGSLASTPALADQPTTAEANAALASYKGWTAQDGDVPVATAIDQCVPTFGQPKTSWTCLLLTPTASGEGPQFLDMPFRRNAKGVWEFDDADAELQGACPLPAEALPILRKHKKADDLTIIIDAQTGGFARVGEAPDAVYYFVCEYAVETKGQKSFVTTYASHHGELYVFSDIFEDNDWPYPNNEWPGDDGLTPSQRR